MNAEIYYSEKIKEYECKILKLTDLSYRENGKVYFSTEI